MASSSGSSKKSDDKKEKKSAAGEFSRRTWDTEEYEKQAKERLEEELAELEDDLLGKSKDKEVVSKISK